MRFPENFVYSGPRYTTFEDHVPAPLFRREFTLDAVPDTARLLIGAAGFYRLFVNGTEITKGALAPYISNPDDIVYYDSYDAAPLLREGENAIGVILGNGMQDPTGGQVWSFQTARFRGAPRFALSLDLPGGPLESGTDWKTAPSAVLFDDIRCGMFYDQRLEHPGWNAPGYDDSGWADALVCERPRGERRLCGADNIVVTKTLPGKRLGKAGITPGYSPIRPVADQKVMFPADNGEGELFDFGVNTAGTVTLRMNGRPGQKIQLQFGEILDGDGNLDYRNISFYPDGYSQRDIYFCAGGPVEFTPFFTYHGARYCLVMGLDEDQKDGVSLEFAVMNSDIDSGRGDFECSDETANAIFRAARVSDLANFYYFPTDCPHREKNGWTGDASVSAEHMLMQYSCEESLREWMRSLYAQQDRQGRIADIAPSPDWGRSVDAPAWENVIVSLPYHIYRYAGRRDIAEEASDALFRYIDRLERSRTADGIIEYGRGDWVPVGRGPDDHPSPTRVTSTLISVDSCKRAAAIFDLLGQTSRRDYALSLYREFLRDARRELVMPDGATVLGRCQTSQAAGLYFGLFDGNDAEAFRVLLRLIDEKDGTFDCGMIGLRVIFRVLGDHGRTDKAWEMIMNRSFPGYANLIERGATSLWESFMPDINATGSFNHHFLGDVSAFFMSYIAGIRVNPRFTDPTRIDVMPCFIDSLTRASAKFSSPLAGAQVRWERSGADVVLDVKTEDGAHGSVLAPDGYFFKDTEGGRFNNNENGKTVLPLKTREYRFMRYNGKH
ncbi:MAG: family 78 glycoside hydrolase catalytic domain [Clostridia bacterium]|nr:family 78 glycoside hydrolase catalytic domain [Clostridia bacterium]